MSPLDERLVFRLITETGGQRSYDHVCSSTTMCLLASIFLNERSHVTRRLQTLSECFQLCFGLHILRWRQELVVGDILAIDSGEKVALLGCVGFRQVRCPSIDPDLDLVRGQAYRINDCTVP